MKKWRKRWWAYRDESKPLVQPGEKIELLVRPAELANAVPLRVNPKASIRKILRKFEYQQGTPEQG